jgi:simple sugar transport system permease protein
MLLTGAAVVLGGKMLLWNCGAEGQLLIGAWAATGIGLFVTGPTPFMLLLMMLCAALAAGLFALVPAWMRIKFGISEILSTILLNYVALYWIISFTQGPWRDTSSASSGMFYSFRVPYELPFLTGNLNIGIVIAVLLVIVLSIVLGGSLWGYEIKSVGANLKAANFAGIPYKRHMFLIMFLSGAIAGLAGGLQLAGVANRLSSTLSVSYGWNGLLVAILAGDSFLALIPYSLFMALLLNGGIVLQTQGLSVFVITALTGLILLLASIGEIAASYRLVRTIPAQLEPAVPEIES